MSNVKAQISNEVESSIVKNVLTLKFDIHLAFACLREAASAKAGILTFGFNLCLGQGFRYHFRNIHHLDSALLFFSESCRGHL